MKKTLIAAVLIIALGGAFPFLAALFLVITLPAAAAAVQCTTIAAPATGGWRPPFQQAYTTTSPFGARTDPITGQPGKGHPGIDLVSLPGPGPVVAASAGTITIGNDPGGYGNHVTIDHGGGITTLYGHLASIDPALRAGGHVFAGQVLGVEGSTGYSTGNHLHYEIRASGALLDPAAFMLDHGAPLNGQPVAPTPAPGTAILDPGKQQGGIGFPLPSPQRPRLASLNNPPQPIPPHMKALYVAAGTKYHLPWTLLAGIGMAETSHGANNTTSSAGAQGLMQFMPATFAIYGVDGDGDGRVDIHSDADSIYSAANYLTASGVSAGEAGVRRALYAYNHADWYVNDVLYYAHAYGGGIIEGDPADCGPTTGAGNPNLPTIPTGAIATVLAWAHSHTGDPYVFGAGGPHAWDCSSFTQGAYARIGITLPRTAEAQRNYLAAGNGHRVPYGQEQPGDLVFIDTYLGPNQIGHVLIVNNPATHQSIEAGGAAVGTYDYAHWANNHIFEIWRVGNTRAEP